MAMDRGKRLGEIAKQLIDMATCWNLAQSNSVRKELPLAAPCFQFETAT